MLKITDLTAGYGGKPVLRNLNLTMQPGQVNILIGPNGCGKSTLLKTIAGLLPYGGAMQLDGAELSSLDHRTRAQKIAYLPQNRPLPDITAERLVLHGRFPYLGYPRKYRKEDHEAAQAALVQMGIADLAQTNVADLSGGTRQKVYIAMALAQNTPVILLDEPTTFLDISHQMQMMETVRSLADQGKTVLMILHDLPMAMQNADRLLLLQEGNLVSSGSPEELFASGQLNRVFGVQMQRTQTPHGWKYYFA